MLVKKAIGLFGLFFGLLTFDATEASQGIPPKCCATATRGNPPSCQSCCQRKWGNNIEKKQRCFKNCQRGFCKK